MPISHGPWCMVHIVWTVLYRLGGFKIYFRVRSGRRRKYEKTENNNNSETIRCTETSLSAIFETCTTCSRIRKSSANGKYFKSMFS